MRVEELKLHNIKCFEEQTLKFTHGGAASPWVTLLSENGCGKTTVLQALALLLAGPEGAQKLLSSPTMWLRDESEAGLLSIRIRQGENDPGTYQRTPRTFRYSFHVTGSKPLTVRDRYYSEPTITENRGGPLPWLRENAFTSTGNGWFAAGYGAFRRLPRTPQINVPTLEPQARFTNLLTLFQEDEPLSAFELWMVYLDYRVSKAGDAEARRKMDMGIAAINRLLPEGVVFDRVTEEGRVCFRVNGTSLPPTVLSDGYRSVLALAGDLVWRLMNAFPESQNPFEEEGVVLIDELDIHLHPIWQRQIAGWLRSQFPNLQFIVATHSPLIAAGAGADALTLKFHIEKGTAIVTPVPDIAAMNVDRILQSEAFGLLSPYSPQTQEKIDRYDALARKGRQRKPHEEEEFGQLRLFMEEARPFGGPPQPGSLDARIEEYLAKTLK